MHCHAREEPDNQEIAAAVCRRPHGNSEPAHVRHHVEHPDAFRRTAIVSGGCGIQTFSGFRRGLLTRFVAGACSFCRSFGASWWRTASRGGSAAVGGASGGSASPVPAEGSWRRKSWGQKSWQRRPWRQRRAAPQQRLHLSWQPQVVRGELTRHQRTKDERGQRHHQREAWRYIEAFCRSSSRPFFTPSMSCFNASTC